MYATGNPKTKAELKRRVYRAGLWFFVVSDGYLRVAKFRDEETARFCASLLPGSEVQKRAYGNVGAFSPGPFPCPENGSVAIEGPQYPAPHRWYATARLVNGDIVGVK